MRIIERDITSVHRGTIVVLCDARKPSHRTTATSHIYDKWPEAERDIRSRIRKPDHALGATRYFMLAPQLHLCHLMAYEQPSLFRPSASMDIAPIREALEEIIRQMGLPVYLPYNKFNTHHVELAEFCDDLPITFCKL